MKEHERVVLTQDLPEAKLTAGDVGTIVHVYSDGEAFEVEFMALDGETIAVVTLERHRIRPVQHREIPHVRLVA